MTDPELGVSSYTYNANNMVTAITNPDGNTTSYEYDALGRRTKATMANGTYTDYQYNDISRLLNLEHKTSVGATISYYRYTYDNSGNRLTMTEVDGSTTTWQYNNRNELTLDKKEDSGLNIIYNNTYTYDAVGNRLTMTDKDSNQTSYDYDNNNRLLSAGGISYTYDATGNLISKTEGGQTTSYEYNYEDKLVKIAYPDASTNEFKYYGNGNRYEKIDSNGTNRYIYNGVNMLMEYDINGSTAARYTMGLGIDEPISIKTSNTTGYYHTDGLGTVREITSSMGAVLNSYTYDAWGNIHSSSETIAQPFTYTAREWDADAGLYYYRARYMDANVGRFGTVDPLYRILNSGVNLFTYSNNNPVNFKDPLGLSSFEDCIKKQTNLYKGCILAAFGKYHADIASAYLIAALPATAATMYGTMKGGPVGGYIAGSMTEGFITDILNRLDCMPELRDNLYDCGTKFHANVIKCKKEECEN